MRLDGLFTQVDVYERPGGLRRIDVSKITDNLDQVEAGALFCAVPGARVDGHSLVPDAVRQGAVAVVTERKVADPGVPVIRVGDVRSALAPIANAFYENPARYMHLAGVTGTNGKTTVTSVLTGILRRHRWKTAAIGTLSDDPYTTLPAIELQHQLAKLREESVEAVVMEVSSIGLVQHRVDTLVYEVGIFTNLTQDHLDFHGSMSKYYDAKAMLFEPGRCRTAVINVDDPYGVKLVERVAGPARPYSLSDIEGLQESLQGSKFTWRGVEISSRLVGRFNVYNVLAAITAAEAMNVPIQQIAEGVANVVPVPGRVERIDRGQPFTVLVDYAHTPDGIVKLLDVARTFASPKGASVAIVFGCGGERDHDKRSLMGKAAVEGADVVMVTTDNSRSEDPEAIIHDVLSGIEDKSKVKVEVDRRAAIREVLETARPNDVVVIAGKGHETTQDIGGVESHFDDREEAAKVLEVLSRGQEGQTKGQEGQTRQEGGRPS